MHKQLIGIVLATMTLLLLAFVVPLVLLISWNIEQRGMAEATQRATALAAVASSLTDTSLPTHPKDGWSATVFLPDDRVLGVPAPRTDPVRRATQCEPSTTKLADDAVEVVVPVRDPRGCDTVVRVLAEGEVLRGNRNVLIGLVLSSSAALVLMGLLLAERLSRGLLRSVHSLAAAADRMATGDLTARVTPNGPAEIRIVGQQLNTLAIRVDHLLDEQRQRGADITHRLRTPLTALRLDIDTVVDEHVARRLIDGHQAVVTALDEVIRTSRRGSSAEQQRLTDLGQTVTDRARFWAVLAQDSHRTIHVDVAPDPLPVRVGKSDLEAALDALLGNVFAHTPDGVPIWLAAAERGSGEAVLTVDDSGPGFAGGDVLRRGHSEGGSTGLGLDIARRTAEEAGGELWAGASPHGGARVQLRFPAPLA